MHLIADIGGTNARFALCSSEAPITSIHSIGVMPSARHPSITLAIRHYLEDYGRPHIKRAVIAIANPIVGDQVKMTNASWTFSIEETRQALGLEALHVINDFTALALSLPHLPAAELAQVGGAAPLPGLPLGLIGPGTGLGVSGLIPVPGSGWLPLSGEGGHVSFAPVDERENMLWQAAKKQFGHVSAERLASGAGLVFIYECLCREHGVAPQAFRPAQVSQRGLSGEDPLCRAALDTFCAILGTVASNLAVTLGARGGMYLGGGIVPKLGDYFITSPFRQRFEDKGRFSDYLAAIPVFIISSLYPGLLGAAAYLSGKINE